jgi:DNA invertase Pin-like site-specific DNA recombinase
MKVTLYARVSTKDQSVDDNMRQLRKWAVNNKHQIVHEVWDTESATIDLKDRKKFLEILNNPKGQAIVVNKLDRITRNFDSVTYIEKYFRENWNTFKLIALDFPIDLESAVGRLMFRNMMTLACFEPEQMKERQRPSIERLKKEGKYLGRQKGAKGKDNNSKRQLLDVINTGDKTIKVPIITKSGKRVMFTVTKTKK